MNKQYKNFNFSFKCSSCFLLLIFFIACKAPKFIATDSPKIPINQYDTFGVGINDTFSIGALSWDTIFRDKNLKNLIEIAIANNNDLLAYQQRIAVTEAQLLAAKNLRKPSLNAQIQTNVDRFGEYTMNGVGNYDLNKSNNILPSQKVPMPITPDLFTGFRSSWEIDLWGQLKMRQQIANYELAATKEEKHVLQTEIVATIATLYYQLLALDEELVILETNSALQKDALNIVTIQKQAGRANELAVQQFNAQYLRTQALFYQIKQSIVEIENQLNFICGQSPKRIIRSQTFSKNLLPLDLTIGSPSMLILNRPDIRKAEQQLLASKANIHVARWAFFPSLNINPYLGLSSFSASKLLRPESIAFGMLGGFNFPLFTKKQNEANWLIAQANNKEAYYQYQKVMIQSLAEVNTQLSGVENKRAELNLKEKERDVLVQAISTADELYNNGLANYLEVITTRKNALDASLETIITKRDLFIHAIQLYKALGGGWK